jgi:TolB-like protein/Tfp pilus assembly protein PilF
MTLPVGTKLGPYEVLAPIGAGGMGEVYRARDTRLERDVAVKVLPESLLADGEALSRFEREAKAVAALSHPNIMAIHDFGRHEHVVYAVMELLQGDTLKERLFASELTQRKALDYALQIVQGLAAAHERGIVHRDLKPTNIFVTRDSLVKILDFGLAKSVRPLSEDSKTGTGTEPGIVLGTAGYMSPEQVRGTTLDQRSDLFSFGLILYEMLAGEPAFRRDTDIETMMAIMKEEPPALSRPGRTISPELADLVGHCLEKKPEERFQSARDLAFALKVIEREGRPGSGPRSGQVSGSAAAAGAEASIAVLPFRNLSADPEAEYFSDGMTEEIITVLSKIDGLRVASRTSAFAFKGRDEDVRKIGAALGARSVLEGSVRQAGRKLRITAQLVDVADGYHLWSETYDREMEDVFAVQDEIARAIAATLKVRLAGPTESGELVAPPTRDVVAYDRYLKGRYLWNQRRAHEAIAEFTAAIEKDPDMVEAHTALADAWAVWGFYGGIPTWEAWARARLCADRAAELAPEEPRVAVSRGLLEHYYGWSSAREEQFCRLAIERAPKWADGYFWLSLCLAAVGKFEESAAIARRGLEIEPHSANMRTALGWSLLFAGRLEEGRRECSHAESIDPQATFAVWGHGYGLQLLGQFQDAISKYEKAIAITGGRYSFYEALRGGALALAGKRAEASAVLEDLKRRSREGEYVPPFDRAMVLAPLGEREAALAALEKAFDERNAFLWLRIHFANFESLRGEPRWQALAAKLARTAPTAVASAVNTRN